MGLIQDPNTGLNVLGGGDGMGGGGILSGLVLGALLGGRGFGGLGTAPVADAVVTSNVATKEDLILQTLGDIKASVPLAEGQVQLALAQNTAQLVAQANANTQAIQTGQTAAALTASTNAALAARDSATINTNVSSTGTMLLAAIKDDGEKTRALITSNQIAELNRIAAERQDEIIELRANNNRDRDRHGIEITMTNNQNQNQLQFQAQAQVLQGLTNALIEVGQIARATNSNVIVGNTGATGVGAQNANPTNVRA